MYSLISEWNLIVEDIDDYWVGSQGSMMGSFVFRKINEELRSIGYETPVGTIEETGRYPQSLSEWESAWACYYLIRRRYLGESAEVPEWLNSLWEIGNLIKHKIQKGQIVLKSDFSPFQTGIQPPQKGSENQGKATLHNNFSGYNGPSCATDFTRTYVVRIATKGSNFLSSEFEWSWDGGISWFDGTYCATDWVSLGTGERFRNVWIRFEYSSTEVEVEEGDIWFFIVYPDYLIVRGDQDPKTNWVARKRYFA